MILIYLISKVKFNSQKILFIYLVAELSATLYWRHTFNSICDPKQLIEYTVMDIEQIKFKDRKFFPGQGTISNKVSIMYLILIFSLKYNVHKGRILFDQN